ncbi:DNA-processing protein DprA [Candidatus Neomarinimicrobiota bacterium]
MITNDVILSLQQVHGLGTRRIRAILNTFPNVTDWGDLLACDLRTVEGISSTLMDRFSTIDQGENRRILDRAHAVGASFVHYWSTDYPEQLKVLYDAPVALYVRGAGKIEEFYLGVVGTRKPTEYGRASTRLLAQELIAAGLGIVSGFARGIDTLAHRTALEVGGATIAVMGCGVDVVYPPENRKIFQSLLESGLVISEYPPGTQPDGHHFPQRNRIISGLSLGTLVVEAGQNSGALITAFHSLDIGREVFAVPGPIDSPKSAGCNQLINRGAKLVMRIEDILAELSPPFAAVPGEQIDLLQGLSDAERGVMEYLDRRPVPIDKIAEDLQWNISDLLGTLLILEMQGLVSQTAGKQFARSR